MTLRTHQTLRVGLRRIIRDQRAGVRARLRAIELLMQVEGLHGETNSPIRINSPIANTKRLKELAAQLGTPKTDKALPRAAVSS
jgi:hypothetical protein